ncbi:MAG: hypothetical protein AAF959_29685 [Cyanobacteria bacterium P01_D01_bin.56]
MTSITPVSVARKENQPGRRLVRVLGWFVSFSQFYGEYKGQALKDRHRWVKELRIHSN